MPGLTAINIVAAGTFLGEATVVGSDWTKEFDTTLADNGAATVTASAMIGSTPNSTDTVNVTINN